MRVLFPPIAFLMICGLRLMADLRNNRGVPQRGLVRVMTQEGCDTTEPEGAGVF